MTCAKCGGSIGDAPEEARAVCARCAERVAAIEVSTAIESGRIRTKPRGRSADSPAEPSPANVG